LRIDVTELRRGIGREATYEFREAVQPVEMAGETVTFEPAQVTARLVNAGDSIGGYFEVSSGAHMLCSRCLKPVLVPIDMEFMVVYQQAPATPGKDDGLEHEVVLYTENRIDVSDDVRQHLVLELPMKPVCGPSCKGLCPRCGRDLNEGDCDCPKTDENPGMSVLKDLLKRE
jgi:uncharacterized protein